MKNIRLIAKLDVKGNNLVKGIQYEGLRKLGKPNEYALKYYKEGIDEILYLDTVASLYNRNNLNEIVKECAKNVFVPLTVGGGIRNLDDVARILDSGADKVAINTAALKNPNLISEVADKYGSQCMVLSIQAKKVSENRWEAYYDNGREKTGIDVVSWISTGYNLGAGEIIVTSVDREGTMKGLEIELIRCVSSLVPIPVIACGGLATEKDFVDAIMVGKADAVAVASSLHYGKVTISTIKDNASSCGINVRR